MQEYGKYITKANRDVRAYCEVNAQDLKEIAAEAASYTACGENGWRRDEFMALPDGAFEDLASIF